MPRRHRSEVCVFVHETSGTSSSTESYRSTEKVNYSHVNLCLRRRIAAVAATAAAVIAAAVIVAAATAAFFNRPGEFC